MSRSLLFNGGTVDAEALVHSRALHYGDGVFRTMLVWEGACRDWGFQYARLAADAARLCLDVPDAAMLRAEVQSLALGRERAVLKLLLWRRAEGRGYAGRTSSAERLLIMSDAPHYAADCWTDGVVATLSPVRLSSQRDLAGVKHLNRLEQVLASRDWPMSASEALMSDEQGHVICGTRSNLFWVRGDRLFTPFLDRCGVVGAMRSQVFAICGDLGITPEESRIENDRLVTADEWFLTNSLIGIWPLRAIDGQIKAAPGPLTARLIEMLNHPRLC